MLNKNEFLLLEDFSDYNRFPKFQPIDDRLHVNKQFSIIIDHPNNTNHQAGHVEVCSLTPVIAITCIHVECSDQVHERIIRLVM